VFKVEIRPLFTGDLTEHPAYKKVKYIVASETDVAEDIGQNAFFIPAYSGMTDEMINDMLTIFIKFLRGF